MHFARLGLLVLLSFCVRMFVADKSIQLEDSTLPVRIALAIVCSMPSLRDVRRGCEFQIRVSLAGCAARGSEGEGSGRFRARLYVFAEAVLCWLLGIDVGAFRKRSRNLIEAIDQDSEVSFFPLGVAHVDLCFVVCVSGQALSMRMSAANAELDSLVAVFQQELGS